MNFRLKKHHLCWSWKLYSSLNVTLTYFLDQSMNFIYQEEILFLLLIFCLINGINLGWCFFFCLITHFIWNRIYVTLTQAFYAWQLVSWAPLLELCRSMKSQLGRICPWRRKTFQLTPSLRQYKSRRAGKDPLLSLLWMETWNKSLLNILVSLYHQIIITSYLVPLHISKTLIHHCCIATFAKITSRKAISSKIDQKKKIC